MPHFENIEKYECLNKETGRREIIPIAPNSLAIAEYRPNHKERPPIARRRSRHATPEVEFEPISVRQMEKEYRQAAREAGEAVGPIPAWKIKGWFKRLLRKLFPSRKKTGPAQGNRSRRSSGNTTRKRARQRPQQGKGGGRPRGQSQSQAQSDGPGKGGQERRRRSRRRSSGSRGQSNATQTGANPQKRQGSSPPPGKPPRQKQSPGSESGKPQESQNNSRNRRRRKPRPPSGKVQNHRNPKPSGDN